MCDKKHYFFSFGIEVTEYPALLVILNYSEGTMNYTTLSNFTLFHEEK